jgi:hypothetical protein
MVSGTGCPTAATPDALATRASSLDPASPVVFGDGLRCIGTLLVRFGATLAVGACQSFGHGASARRFPSEQRADAGGVNGVTGRGTVRHPDSRTLLTVPPGGREGARVACPSEPALDPACLRGARRVMEIAFAPGCCRRQLHEVAVEMPIPAQKGSTPGQGRPPVRGGSRRFAPPGPLAKGRPAPRGIPGGRSRSGGRRGVRRSLSDPCPLGSRRGVRPRFGWAHRCGDCDRCAPCGP